MIVVVQITKKSRFIRRHSQKRFIFYGLGYKLYPKKEPSELNRIEMNSVENKNIRWTSKNFILEWDRQFYTFSRFCRFYSVQLDTRKAREERNFDLRS